MELTNLTDKIPKLISAMKTAGYSANYIGLIEKMSKWICEQLPIYEWNSFEEIEATVSSVYTSKTATRSLLARLHLIQRFYEDGILSSAGHRFLMTSSYRKLCAGYKNIVDRTFGKGLTPVDKDYKMWSVISTFLLRLQNRSMLTLSELSQNDILEVFSTMGKQPPSRAYMATLKDSLIRSIPVCGGDVIGRILSFLPCPPRVRKNTQFLTQTEIDALLDILENGDSISLRDKAIFSIAYYTGIRSIDISSMMFKNIDWRNDLILLIQHKTRREVRIPLRAVVGNAIFDYLENERPECDLPYLFLSERKPYRKLESASLYGACRKIMKEAGIRLSKGERRGLHLLRHNLATSLLSNGVAQPVISETLGHASPRSLDHYLDADLIKLKECSLSIEKYPIKNNLFNP